MFKLRRFFRFRLATLFVVVTLFCLWLGVESHQARNQARVVAVLQQASCIVFFEHRLGNELWMDSYGVARWKEFSAPLDDSKGPRNVTANGINITNAPAPDWILNVLGEHYFVRPRSVYLIVAEGGNTLLRDVSTLSGLRQLDVIGGRDSDLSHLARLRKLETLTLVSPQITDASIPHLAKLTSLERLDVSETGISRQGVGRLKSLLPGWQIHGNQSQMFPKPETP